MSASMILLAANSEKLLEVLLTVILGAIACVGFGAAMLVLRIILPGVARSSDASLGRMRTSRLFLAGILPLVGATLLARGVELAGSEVVEAAYLFVVALPIALALLMGAMAGLPYLGAQVLRADADPSPLACASIGGLVTGLAMVSWALPPLGMLVSVLLAGWLLGIGLGGLLRTPRKGAAPDAGAP